MISASDQIAAELSPARRYFVFALVLTIGIHAGLYGISRVTRIEALSPSYYNRIIPRSFTVKPVEIDPKTLADADPKPTPRPPAKPLTDISTLQLGAKQPSLDELIAKADQVIAAPEVLEKSIVQDKPQVAPSAALAKSLADTLKPSDAPPGEPGSMLDQLAESKLPANGRPLIEMPKSKPGEAGGNAAPAPGEGTFSSLDGILSQGGVVSDRTAPILLPTDLLFDYDHFELRPEALDSLRKLGQLILRNPNADFLIEGHTDAFGSAVYNVTLSERRALSVKQWLVGEMGIDAARILTKGFGSSKPLASVAGTVEQQRLNRRVEIVIKTRRR